MSKVFIDKENPSLQRINERCIDCGTCLNTCKKNNAIKDEDCICCGQCILTCPMGALVPRYTYKEVFANIQDEEKITVVSIAPSVRVAIGDEFGFAPGEFLERKLVGVLKALGFDYVFDVTFGADLTIIEEATELITRLKAKNNLPMFTSCCPSWVFNMEKYHSNDLHLLSTCKSPIGMQGAVIKHCFAKMKNLNPKDIVTVTIAPCTAKKAEIQNDPNNDYVLTTSELAMLIREKEISFSDVLEADFDEGLGKGTGAGVLFGTSGGVMEAALRTAYYLLNKKSAPLELLHLESVRGNLPIKEAVVDLGITKIKVAAIYGIANINKMYEQLKDYDFVEVMTCPNGCVGGGGQTILPTQKQKEYIEKRSNSLQKDDAISKKRCSYENEEIQKLYQEYLKNPFSEEAKKILHRTYENKSSYLNI